MSSWFSSWRQPNNNKSTEDQGDANATEDQEAAKTPTEEEHKKKLEELSTG